ncbi:hydantoinase/oxoprolinase family protein [Bordetella pertussis]
MCSRAYSHYVESCRARCARDGVTVALKVTKCNGGVMSAEHGKANCVQMILSGTASGVIGAAYIADLCHIPNCMSLGYRRHDCGRYRPDRRTASRSSPRGEYIGRLPDPLIPVGIGVVGGRRRRVESPGVDETGRC